MSDSKELSPSERARQVRRVVWVELFLNLLVASVKAVYGAWSGSLAVASDALHSFLDAGANIIGLVALRLSDAPPDPEHPYGHRKFEIVAATAIGVVIAGGVIQFGKGCCRLRLRLTIHDGSGYGWRFGVKIFCRRRQLCGVALDLGQCTLYIGVIRDGLEDAFVL